MSKESEIGVCGSVLKSPPTIVAANALQPTDFADPYCAAFFEVASDFHRRRLPIDPLTVAETLATKQPFTSKVDVAAFFAELAEKVITSAHVSYFAGLVLDSSIKRQTDALCEFGSEGARNGKASSEALNDIIAGAQDLQRRAVRESLLADAVSASQFVQQDHRIEYLIPQIIVAGQAGIISAKSKCLKTSVAIDAHVSMSTATPFLNHWRIEEPINCAILSAESGAATIAETIRRVCNSRGVDAETELSRMIVSTRCPRLRESQWLDEIRRFIEANELRCLTIDPTYLAVGDVDSSKLASMGDVLAPIGSIIGETGCTVILVHHNRKNPASPFGPPTLDEITGSGYAEWARFWLLLNRRRDWDEETGSHALWLVSGGSAGFGARKWLDVREGRQSDIGGRVWEVEVVNASEGERDEKQSVARERDQEREAKAAERERAVVDAMRDLGGQASKNGISTATGMSYGVLAAPLAALLTHGDIVPCRVKIESSNRTCDGFKFNEK